MEFAKVFLLLTLLIIVVIIIIYNLLYWIKTHSSLEHANIHPPPKLDYLVTINLLIASFTGLFIVILLITRYF